MTETEIKIALNEYRDLRKAHDQIVRIIAELELKATATGSPSPKADKVMTSLPQSARYEDDIINKADLERVLADSIMDLTEARQRVEELISHANTDTQKRILQCRYILQMDYYTIAKVMSYTIDNIYKIHRKAVKAIAKSVQ